MYQLQVYYPGQTFAQAVIDVKQASEALDLIPDVLAKHQGCERVVVMMGTNRLFAVDCSGNRLP